MGSFLYFLYLSFMDLMIKPQFTLVDTSVVGVLCRLCPASLLPAGSVLTFDTLPHTLAFVGFLHLFERVFRP